MQGLSFCDPLRVILKFIFLNVGVLAQVLLKASVESDCSLFLGLCLRHMSRGPSSN